MTRPAGQADRLSRSIAQHGGVALRFPALDIEPLGQTEDIVRQLRAMENVRWLIFISANAVNFALNWNSGKIDQLKLPPIVAVGGATAKALRDKGLTVDVLPQQGFNSDALLQMPAMQDVRGKRCVIVRGRGGREKLAETLIERGASVEYLEVYRRVMPRGNVTQLLAWLRRKEVDAVTITSGEALQNLLTMLGEHAPLLFTIPLIVVSDRIGQMAEKMGFVRIIVSEGPTDEAILQTLITLQRGKQWPK